MASSLALLVETILGARRVRRQTFAARQRRGQAAERLRTLARNRENARPLLKIVHAQCRRKARAFRRREHVVGTGAVVAQRLRAVVPDENRARVFGTAAEAELDLESDAVAFADAVTQGD